MAALLGRRATVDTAVGCAIGGAFSWTLVNLDHFAFVGRLLIFMIAHVELGHDGGRGQRLGTRSKGSKGSESICG